jgi:hypothetical protein
MKNPGRLFLLSSKKIKLFLQHKLRIKRFKKTGKNTKMKIK